MTTATVPVVTVDPEALAYADQVGMRAALDHMLAATPRLVPGLRSVHVRLKPDYDDGSKLFFVWDVHMDRTTREVYRAADQAWMREYIRVTPQRPLEHRFYFKLLIDDFV